MSKQFFASLEGMDTDTMPIFSDQDIDFFNHLEVDLPDDIAMEGVMGSIGHNFKGIGHAIATDMGSWLKGREAKRKYIESVCQGIIEWLKEKDQQHPNLSLDSGAIGKWFKTSEAAFWRFYFLLNDHTWSEIKKQLRNGDVTELETLTDANLSKRYEATKPIKEAHTIKDLIKIVNTYIDRSNEYHLKMFEQKRKIKKFPFNVVLAGAIDLRITMKKTVTVAL